MTHVSKKQLNQKTERELLHSFNFVLSDIRQEDEMEYFLNSLLSSTERLMLAKRLAIVILLNEGVPQANIVSALHVTQATVSRMQLFLESRGGGYKVSLKKLAKKKMYVEFKNFLFKIAKYSISAAGGYVKPEVLK